MPEAEYQPPAGKLWAKLYKKNSLADVCKAVFTWCSLDNLPSGITADLPFCGGGNQYNPSVDGMSEAHIENGVFTCATRTAGFDDTGHDPFIFAFLVRDDVPVQTEGNGNIDLPGGDDH